MNLSKCPLALLLLTAACAPEGSRDELASCEAAGATRVAVVKTLRFARQDNPGESWGFDLDGETTESGDRGGCGVQDYTDPEGNTGIDNGFANLIPVLELTEAGAVEPLIASAIASGELLFMAQLSNLNDPADDPCVDFAFARGVGDPDLSSAGEVLPGQTFDRDPDIELVEFEDLVMVDDSLVARPFVTHVPITFFDVHLDFEIQNAAIRVIMDEDGAMHGYLGGGLDTETLVSLAAERSSDPTLAHTIRSLLAIAADLDPGEDGVCRQIAINFEFEAVSAFFYAD